MSNLYVFIMCSRNKDNKDVPNFKQRTKTLLEYVENNERVLSVFQDFASKGVPGEKSRLYRSANSRNEEKIREDLIVRLVKDKPSLPKLNSTLAHVAQKIENRDESKWLFDFDVDNKELANQFIQDIFLYSGDYDQKVEQRKTPHGYAIVVPHGFDTRELMEKWKDYDVTLKKDDMLFLKMITKE